MPRKAKNEPAIKVGDLVWMEYLEGTYDRWVENWIPMQAEVAGIDRRKGLAYFVGYPTRPLVNCHLTKEECRAAIAAKKQTAQRDK